MDRWDKRIGLRNIERRHIELRDIEGRQGGWTKLAGETPFRGGGFANLREGHQQFPRTERDRAHIREAEAGRSADGSAQLQLTCHSAMGRVGRLKHALDCIRTAPSRTDYSAA
jgi:hypothetical protein